MVETAISVTGLGKRYQIGQERSAGRLSEALTGLTVHPPPVAGVVDHAVVDELIDRALELA